MKDADMIKQYFVDRKIKNIEPIGQRCYKVTGKTDDGKDFTSEVGIMENYGVLPLPK